MVVVSGLEFGENLTETMVLSGRQADADAGMAADAVQDEPAGFVLIGDEICSVLHWGRTNITCVSAPNSAGFKNVTVRQFGKNGLSSSVAYFVSNLTSTGNGTSTSTTVTRPAYQIKAPYFVDFTPKSGSTSGGTMLQVRFDAMCAQHHSYMVPVSYTHLTLPTKA